MFENIFMGAFIKAQIQQGAEFKKFVFPLETLNWLHTIQFSFSISNENCYGLGSDPNIKNAYIKSVVEYYERKAFFEVGRLNGFNSTNGIAGHRFKLLARQAALSELYERDSFLCHWYSQTPFLTVESSNKKILKTVDEMKSNKIRTLFFKTFLGVQETHLCFLVDIQTGGFALGLSSGKSYTENITKAFSEAAINYFLGHQGKSKDELLKDLENEGLCNLKNHRTYWLHFKPLPEWVHSQPNLTLHENNKFDYAENIHLQMNYGPIKVIGVKVSEIFTLSLGKPTAQDHLKLSRRIKFDKLAPSIEAMEPHPIP